MMPGSLTGAGSGAAGGVPPKSMPPNAIRPEPGFGAHEQHDQTNGAEAAEAVLPAAVSVIPPAHAPEQQHQNYHDQEQAHASVLQLDIRLWRPEPALGRSLPRTARARGRARRRKIIGTGKTTLAVQLAITLARAGRDVLLVDGDLQASSQAAIAIRTDSGKLPALACVHYPEGRVLRDQVRHQARKYADVVIDAGGRDSGALRAALVLSDILLIPFLPRSVDVWALADIAALVDEASAVRDNRHWQDDAGRATGDHPGSCRP